MKPKVRKRLDEYFRLKGRIKKLDKKKAKYDKELQPLRVWFKKYLTGRKNRRIQIDEDHTVTLVEPERIEWNTEGLRKLLTTPRVLKRAKKHGFITTTKKKALLNEIVVTTEHIDPKILNDLLESKVLRPEDLKDIMSVVPQTSYVR